MKRFGWIVGAAVMLVAIHGGNAPARGQGLRAEGFLSKVASWSDVPQRHIPRALTLASYGPEKQGRFVQLISPDWAVKRTSFWTDSTVLLASPRHGKFAVEGLERSFSGKALAHPAEATPTRDALRTEIGTASMRAARTFYGVRITVGLGKR